MLDGMGSSGHVVCRLLVMILETSLSLRGVKEGNDEPLTVAPLGGGSGGTRDFFLQVLWGCSAFYRWCYEMRVMVYVSHGSLLQHFHTISSVICLHDCS